MQGQTTRVGGRVGTVGNWKNTGSRLGWIVNIMFWLRWSEEILSLFRGKMLDVNYSNLFVRRCGHSVHMSDRRRVGWSGVTSWLLCVDADKTFVLLCGNILCYVRRRNGCIWVATVCVKFKIIDGWRIIFLWNPHHYYWYPCLIKNRNSWKNNPSEEEPCLGVMIIWRVMSWWWGSSVGGGTKFNAVKDSFELSMRA